MKQLKVAVIPAKSNSSRVPEKNFKDFHDGFSLLEIKIQQCISSKCFDSIFVSSDSEAAREIAERNGVSFILRDEKLCQDSTPWNEVLTGILNSVPVPGDALIAWCPVTSPLFSRFSEVFEKLDSNENCDSVITVTPQSHYFLNSDFIPINHQWGVWHAYSQKVKPLYQFNLACIVSKKNTMIKNQYQIGDRPDFFFTSFFEGIDIDTMDEFEIAQLLYARKMKMAEASVL